MGLLQRWGNRRRDKLAEGLEEGGLRHHLSQPPLDQAMALSEARLLAIDLETTGLDPARDRMLSYGFVPVDGDRILLAGAAGAVIASDSPVGESVTLHGITDDRVAEGQPLPEALETIFAALTGRVLLAHHAAIEVGFLAAACESVHGVRPRFQVVDTMSLQFRLLTQGYDDEPPQGSLRLWAARGQYGLPRYAAHDALVDALACAELYLAQIAELSIGGSVLRLRDVLR